MTTFDEFYTGTESWTVDVSPTEILYDYSRYDDDYAPMTCSTKELLILENAEKATETMVFLARVYRRSIYYSMFVRAIPKVLRTIFSHSGKLPKRIRRIRKSR